MEKKDIKIIAAVMLVDGMTDESTESFVKYFGESLFDDPRKITEELSFLKNEFPDINVPDSFGMDVLLVKADAVLRNAERKGIDVRPEDGCMFAFEYGSCGNRTVVPVKTRSDFIKYKELI
ncbi:MAG: hypothetical protein VZQ84_05430 [Anaerovoracaceae bacterium]|nr:hypothetical protein [Anaerovoracaceae bacterium]